MTSSENLTQTEAVSPVLAALDSIDPDGIVEIPADRQFQPGLKILTGCPAEFTFDL